MARKKVERNISFDTSKKRYYVTLYFGFGPDGKPLKKTRSFKTITEARKILREHERKRDCQSLVTPNKITLEDWLTYWIDNIVKPNRATTTVYGYQQMLNNHIIPQLGKIELQKLTAPKIQTYLTHLRTEKNLCPNTVRKHLDLLRSALGVAVRQEVLHSNPASRVDPPAKEVPVRRFYTQDDLRRLIQCAKGHRLELVIQLAAYLGLRREEYCGLQWSDINFDKHELYIRRARTTAGSQVVEKCTKTTSSIRTLHIPQALEQALLNAQMQQNENRLALRDAYTETDYILVWNDGKPYRPNYLSELFAKFVKENNLPPLTLHGLRHTFATLANDSGATMYDISKALGHSTVATTSMIYTHIIDNSHKDTIERVAAYVQAY